MRRQPLDSLDVGQGLEEADQHLPLAQSRDLVLGWLADLRNQVRREGIVDDRRPRLGVRLIRERCGDARCSLDHDREPGPGEPSSSLRNQRDSALPGGHFTRNPDPHGASVELRTQ